MKNLYLARHAKSDWSIDGISDFDRPLNARGYSQAHNAGVALKSEMSGSIKMITSPAIRAISTCLIIAKGLNLNIEEIEIQKVLYEAKPEIYLKLITELDDQFDSVFIFGHNPTTSEVLIKITNARISELPTCAIIKIGFETNTWSNVLTAKNQILSQLFP